MANNSYSSEFTKTLSSGITALVTGKKDYYILEHLVGSHYHQAGEKQEIMIDNVVLGRDTDCNVRFDESFSTVSRHHASIIRDGDNWRLIQLSKKNTTFLNGKAVQDSWYLQSGDEIQLAVNGPKLIFRIPTKTTEFNVSERLRAFKEQVIRPYQTAFIVVCCVIVLLIGGGITAGVVIWKQHEHIATLDDINSEQKKQIDALFDQLMQTNDKLTETALRADSAQQEAIKAKQQAFKQKAEVIRTQENLQEVLNQMQQLSDEVNSYYDGIINGDNQ